MVFLPRFPLCSAHAPSVQRKNTGRLRCQELCAAFCQLLCIPPLSPPAASHDLPKKLNVSAVLLKAWPVRGFCRAFFCPGTGLCRCHLLWGPGTRLAALCLLEQPLGFSQNGTGSLFLCVQQLVMESFRGGGSAATLSQTRAHQAKNPPLL